MLALGHPEGSGHAALAKSAADVIAKVKQVLPQDLRAALTHTALFVANFRPAAAVGVDPAQIRATVRRRRKLDIFYRDVEGRVHGAPHLAGGARLLHRRDSALRLVRAAPRLPPFPPRPHRGADAA
jgi:hypothetical protein